jgi:hypothetical protein
VKVEVIHKMGQWQEHNVMRLGLMSLQLQWTKWIIFFESVSFLASIID